MSTLRHVDAPLRSVDATLLHVAATLLHVEATLLKDGLSTLQISTVGAASVHSLDAAPLRYQDDATLLLVITVLLHVDATLLHVAATLLHVDAAPRILEQDSEPQIAPDG